MRGPAGGLKVHSPSPRQARELQPVPSKPGTWPLTTEYRPSQAARFHLNKKVEMPYSIRKDGEKYNVVNQQTGKVHGTFDTKQAAREQQKALYANTTEGK